MSSIGIGGGEAGHDDGADGVADIGGVEMADAEHAPVGGVAADQQEHLREQHRFQRNSWDWIKGGTVFSDLWPLRVSTEPHVQAKVQEFERSGKKVGEETDEGSAS